jgi:hypothetical protein
MASDHFGKQLIEAAKKGKPLSLKTHQAILMNAEPQFPATLT